MAPLALDDDAIVAIAATVMALGALFLCWRAFARRHRVTGALWLIVALGAGALAWFFTSFTMLPM